ncbi:MAG: porin [Herminiimonas sp.]|nr:porin [Herminiimonas sp.]
MSISKKTLIAAAVSAACALPLMAQAQSSVTVYGKLYPQISNYRVTDASAPGTAVSTLKGGTITGTAKADVTGTQMESSNSRLGFRGTEDLGGNLKAIFQLEMALGVDDGALPTAGVLFGRDTFVGLSGGFGTVRLGSMDTVYKSLGDTLSFLGISSGNFVATSNVLSKPGLGTSSSASFHTRQGNSIIYESPEYVGFQGLFGYSLGEVAGSTRSKAVVSTGVKYEKGPIYVALMHEIHNDLFGGSNNVAAALSNIGTAGATSKDTATRVTGQYKFTSNTRAEVNLSRLKYSESGGTTGKFADYRTTTWSLGAEHKIGAFTLAASYAQASAGDCSLVGGVACSTSGLDGKMLSLGGSYALSKRTALYAIFANLTNGASATYSNLGGSAAKPAIGADIRQAALGITHSF